MVSGLGAAGQTALQRAAWQAALFCVVAWLGLVQEQARIDGMLRSDELGSDAWLEYGDTPWLILSHLMLLCVNVFLSHMRTWKLALACVLHWASAADQWSFSLVQ